MSLPDTEGTVQTTQTSLDILMAIRDRDGARLREVADQVGVAKSTAYKHLTTLERNGYLRKNGETYHIGLKFLHYGEYARKRWPGFSHIKDAVAELAERTEEDIDFVVEDHGRITTIEESYHPWVKYDDRSEEAPSDGYRANIGDYYHMHSTAAGLAILAEHSTDRVREIINRWGLPARTEHTITEQATLFEVLDRVRERGYAVNDQGYTEGMRSLGKAVEAPDGTVLGAFSVSGPTYRLDGAVLEREIPTALQEVVASLEADLTARWSS
ncbi:MAG: IclR family transcriptional regulator [Haloglomus sp.]